MMLAKSGIEEIIKKAKRCLRELVIMVSKLLDDEIVIASSQQRQNCRICRFV